MKKEKYIDSEKLAIKPCYEMKGVRDALKKQPKSTLNADNAYLYYKKMVRFLAIKERSLEPFYYKGQLALFNATGCGFFRPIKWMPELKDDWCRLSFRLFCIAYGIEQKSNT